MLLRVGRSRACLPLLRCAAVLSALCITPLQAVEPSNPNTGAEAKRLLEYLSDIGGKAILSGQESMFWDNQFATPSVRDKYVFERVDAYPALYSTDFGDFHHESDLARRAEILNMRPGVVDAVTDYAAAGSVIQLHYHMVEPSEPDGSGLRKYTASAPYNATLIERALTTGDPLNVEYLRRLDEIAGYLSILQERGVPVLWRPFHEMNGAWFWWGQQPGFTALWRHMWDYFTYTHNLNNLLWVFSVNYWPATAPTSMYPDNYYPGDDYVDVLGVDVYRLFGHAFDKRVHDHLLALGGGRPIAITENGVMPDLESLIASGQTRWTYWTTWFGFEAYSTDALYTRNYSHPRVITQDEVFDVIEEPPNEPVLPSVTAETSPGEVSLSWTPVAGATWYNVWRGEAGADSLRWLRGTGNSTLVDSSVAANSRYWYAVTIYTNGEDSAFSNVVSVTTPPVAIPESPPSIRVTGTTGQVELGWEAVPGVNWYNVWRSSSGADSLQWLRGTGTEAFTDVDVAMNTQYWYAVTSYVASSDSAFSNVVSATPTPADTVVSAPTKLWGRSTSRQATLKWRGSADVGWYNVWRGTSASSLNWIAGTGTPSFTDEGLVSGKKYYYAVTAYDAGVDSDFSNIIRVRIR